MAARTQVRTQVDLLNAIRPQFSRYAVTQHLLKAEADSKGVRVVNKPYEDIVNKLKLLDAEDQAVVANLLQRGEPAIAYRRPQRGEPAGRVQMIFYPIRLSPKIPPVGH